MDKSKQLFPEKIATSSSLYGDSNQASPFEAPPVEEPNLDFLNNNDFIDDNPISQNGMTVPFQQTIELYRSNVKKTNDPQVQLDFALFLLDSSSKQSQDEKGLPQKGPDSRNLRVGLLKKSNTDPNLHSYVTNGNGDLSTNNFASTPSSYSSNAKSPSMMSSSTPAMQKSLQKEAIKWLKKVASLGVNSGKQCGVDAQYILAEAYGKGLYGLSTDFGKAFSLYLQASKQNHAESTYRVAVCYELGAGVKKDNNRAMSYYRKAASMGNPYAMHKLGLILLQGLLNQGKNEREAITWLKRASQHADKSHPQPLHDLAQCHEPGYMSSNAVLPDESYALELYSKAAELGYAPSQHRLGLAFEYGQLGYNIDPKASIHWYRKAADQGFPEAELGMSGWFLTGAEAILPQSDTEAYLWARRAAEQGLLKAIYAVAYYSENGIGVRADLEEAKRWYLKASKQGHAKSTHRLQELRKQPKLSSNNPNLSNPAYNYGNNNPRNTKTDNNENCCIQ